MITINKQKYAANESQFINSLASPGGTCSGYYERKKRHIRLFDEKNNPIGLINSFGVVQFIPKIENKINYSLLEQHKDVQRIKKKVEIINHESNYTYK